MASRAVSALGVCLLCTGCLRNDSVTRQSGFAPFHLPGRYCNYYYLYEHGEIRFVVLFDRDRESLKRVAMDHDGLQFSTHENVVFRMQLVADQTVEIGQKDYDLTKGRLFLCSLSPIAAGKTVQLEESFANPPPPVPGAWDQAEFEAFMRSRLKHAASVDQRVGEFLIPFAVHTTNTDQPQGPPSPDQLR